MDCSVGSLMKRWSVQVEAGVEFHILFIACEGGASLYLGSCSKNSRDSLLQADVTEEGMDRGARMQYCGGLQGTMYCTMAEKS